MITSRKKTLLLLAIGMLLFCSEAISQDTKQIENNKILVNIDSKLTQLNKNLELLNQSFVNFANQTTEYDKEKIRLTSKLIYTIKGEDQFRGSLLEYIESIEKNLRNIAKRY